MRNVIAVLCVAMLGGLLACTQENSPPKTYGVGPNYAGAATAFGNQNVGIPTFVDVQDAMVEEVLENDTVVETDLPENDLGADAEVTCTGSDTYCTCMVAYNDDPYCTCKDETPESQTLYCECTMKVCVNNPDPDMAVQYSTFCPTLYPTECEGF